jgi:hypothetical protein
VDLAQLPADQGLNLVQHWLFSNAKDEKTRAKIERMLTAPEKVSDPSRPGRKRMVRSGPEWGAEGEQAAFRNAAAVSSVAKR